jgi:hypothetical protein
MKTITTLLIASATAISLNASAGIYLGVEAEDEYNANSLNNFPTVTQTNSPSVVTLNEDEYKYGESMAGQDIASVLNELENSPPAAGRSSSSDVTILGSHADEEYQHTK